MAVDLLTEAEALIFSFEKVVQVFETQDTLYQFPAVNLPAWSKTQAIAVTLGGDVKGDGLGGVYYWDASSTASDDALAVIQPDAIEVDAVKNPTGAGRWLVLFCGFWDLLGRNNQSRMSAANAPKIRHSPNWFAAVPRLSALGLKR